MPGGEEAAGLGVGLFGGEDGVAQDFDFVGILPAAEDLVGAGDVDPLGSVGEGGEDAAGGGDAKVGSEGAAEGCSETGGNVFDERAEFLRIVGDVFVGGGSVEVFAGCGDDGLSFAGDENGGEGEGLFVPIAGEGVNVVAIDEQGGVEVLLCEETAEGILAGATGSGIEERDGAHWKRKE